MNETYDYIMMEESNEIPDTVKLNNDAVAKCLVGRFQEGISDFTTALEKTPNNTTILSNRSIAYRDARIVDLLASFGFEFTGSTTTFYKLFQKFSETFNFLS